VTAGAVLLLGHGSPDAAGQHELLELGDLVGWRLGCQVGIGVLEFSTPELPGLDGAFAELRGRGPVAAQPLVLFEGLHGRYDLPVAAARAASLLGLDIRLGEPLGRDPRLTELVTNRLLGLTPAKSDLLLFVGRGSSEPMALEQTREVAELVSGRAGTGCVVCYTGISQPDLATGMRAALEHRPGRVLALPYLLHTGVLVRRVREVLLPIAEREGVDLVVLPHIGNDTAVVELVASRLEQLTAEPSLEALPPPAGGGRWGV
jgi:sirohydrochlorin cobaltochelatase